ncbi:DNA invertase Pin-like site-specific DNA recombinase [Rhodoblastus acidophilus]|uniref:recombinase family protein n=1 Tax=Rhodoblastus acidophilus TaxID=1074 RepID=UPI00222539AA|nr:recombinase family protein [Rhodoblastus acidophilus]MCW2319257.1 DNA invertase Pin-like site-specific DNA recombinase [Rhodoblastus acidophilus]
MAETPMIYGYARVSTDGQSVDAQVRQLREAGAEKVFRETASGVKTDRAQLRRAVAQLDKDDVLLVSRLDRLARSTRDLLNVLAEITERGAGFRSLADAWADTTTPHGRLMLTVLGGLAEFERDLIRARTSEGRARAKANGVKLGRKTPKRLLLIQRDTQRAPWRSWPGLRSQGARGGVGTGLAGRAPIVTTAAFLSGGSLAPAAGARKMPVVGFAALSRPKAGAMRQSSGSKAAGHAKSSGRE